MHIALLTESRYLAEPEPDAPEEVRAYLANVHLEDALLSAALLAHGIRASRVDWSDPRVEWARFAAAVFRTTWDYFDRIAEFRAWLGDVEPRMPLIHNGEIVRWNMDKHYLLDLERAGVRIVPTQVVRRGAGVSLSSVLTARGWGEGIAKPAISGSARHTWRARPGDAASDARFEALIFEEDMLVQPFVPGVMSLGEVSLMVIGGRYSHAVRKLPKAGDFRVQDDHGGTVHAHVATDAERAFAEAAVAAVDAELVYARVDVVAVDEGLALMELELIEPELWMRAAPESAVAFAAAIVGALRGRVVSPRG